MIWGGFALVNMALSQLFWDMLLPPNSKSVNIFLNNYTFSPVNHVIAFFSTVNKMCLWDLQPIGLCFFFLFLCILHIVVPVWELELHYVALHNPFLSQSYKGVFITLHSYFPNNPCPQLQQQPNQMAVFSGNVSMQQVKSATRRTLVFFCDTHESQDVTVTL